MKAAGTMIPDKIRDIQKIHRQPRRSVRTPPRMSPMLIINQHHDIPKFKFQVIKISEQENGRSKDQRRLT